MSALETRLAALREQDAELAQQFATEAATAPDSGDLEAVADRLERTIAEADPRQAKALLRLLIKVLRVNGRSEILPTYRIVTPEVCALPSSVGGAGIEPPSQAELPDPLDQRFHGNQPVANGSISGPRHEPATARRKRR